MQMVFCLFFRTFASVMTEISVLIPTYNDRILSQVSTLQSQLEALSVAEDLCYEVVVADDCSTDEAVVRENEEILHLVHCRLVREPHNIGRAAIRNRLAQEARYRWLLYIDAHLFIPNGFIRGYVHQIGKAQVVCGGSMVDGLSQPQGLRYQYELDSLARFSAEARSKTPFRCFRTNNFMIDRDLMLAHPLRSDIKTYGYEDVLFGKTLEEAGASILHIDNPVGYHTLESNQLYINKVEESLHTLFAYREELEGYSPLLDGVEMLRRKHLLGVARQIYTPLATLIRRNLTGKNPSLLLFKVFKVGTYLQIMK